MSCNERSDCHLCEGSHYWVASEIGDDQCGGRAVMVHMSPPVGESVLSFAYQSSGNLAAQMRTGKNSHVPRAQLCSDCLTRVLASAIRQATRGSE